ncbi:hypothetical protein FHY55_00440 [Oceanicola sp. D3]|uniref:hypothetical protein n=1 Tax=Oceanicola sp. D3 TaxID=2587163 RepID=UPI00111EFC97|nr:hypothetical protein [Oceanicola sp. D3]QDC07803.1 hypothetical protein FHY55_00440 [Oceanicola sp. D3]
MAACALSLGGFTIYAPLPAPCDLVRGKAGGVLAYESEGFVFFAITEAGAQEPDSCDLPVAPVLYDRRSGRFAFSALEEMQSWVFGCNIRLPGNRPDAKQMHYSFADEAEALREEAVDLDSGSFKLVPELSVVLKPED